MLGLFVALLLVAEARPPLRAPPQGPRAVVWTPGTNPGVLVFKVAEHVPLDTLASVAPKGGALEAALARAEPLFSRSPEALRDDRRTYDPEGKLADLTRYWRVQSADAAALGTRLLKDERVELAYLAPLPAPPPVDIDPPTPDFSEDQGYAGPAPGGFGFDVAERWPGGRGGNVTIANVEFGWDDEHEDLEALVGAFAHGHDALSYAFHGNAVMGILVAGDNGYGVRGLVPDADVLLITPYEDADSYNPAAAIDAAAALLDAGDVLLIEQQAYVGGLYGPIESIPAVFDAIALAVAKGIVIVEPAGNGALDLDDAVHEGWFDRSQRDSGAILVGGGNPPGEQARAWTEWGSSYGERVDVQGWFADIVTTSAGDYGATWADLYYPDEDGRQAYTSAFGGTSGAAPIVAAVAAAANSVAWEVWGTPWDPIDLRAVMVQTGTPQPEDDPHPIGPQPDLRRLLQTWMVR